MPPSRVPRHLLAIDAALAGSLLLLGELGALAGDTSLPRWVGAALTAAYTAPLAVRRRWPVPVSITTVLGVVALGLLDPAGEQPTIPLAMALAAYTLGRYGRPPYAWVLAAASLSAFWAVMLVSGVGAPDVVFASLMYVPPYAFGAALRRREQRAVQQAAQSVDAERARIARELHDIVAHSLSVVTLQTQVLRRRLEPDRPDEAQTLRQVERTAREAMAEMRRLLGTVRSGPAPLQPQPGLASLETLLEETRQAGIVVESIVSGAALPLNPGLDLAGYRIVQEALTNVRRHARATRTTVELRYGPDQLEIDVRDNGTARPGPVGNGLIGMRERTQLYGGQFAAGPESSGGYRVQVRLPIGANA